MATPQTRVLKSVVESDLRPILIRTARIPTEAYVVGDTDQDPVAPNLIYMLGNDMIYLLIHVSVVTGGMGSVSLRVEFAYEPGGDWYADTALNIGAAVDGVVPVAANVMEYVFTPPLDTEMWYRIVIPVDDPILRVSIKGNATPAVGDVVEVKAVRTIRDSLVGPR